MSDEKVVTLKLADKPQESMDDVEGCVNALNECIEVVKATGKNKILVLMLKSDDDTYEYQFIHHNIRHSEKLALMDVVHDHVLRSMMGLI